MDSICSHVLLTHYCIHDQVEPITEAMLELSKLRQYKSLQYMPSRNRQWHMYGAVERPDKRSYPLRRLFARGVVRQLGCPALLAASYSGNSAAVATAVISEVEEELVSFSHRSAARFQPCVSSPQCLCFFRLIIVLNI